jgi:hypothetical protein
MIAPLIGLSSAQFSCRKNGRVSWELDKVYKLMEYLGLPIENVQHYFVGGILPQKKRWNRPPNITQKDSPHH